MPRDDELDLNNIWAIEESNRKTRSLRVRGRRGKTRKVTIPAGARVADINFTPDGQTDPPTSLRQARANLFYLFEELPEFLRRLRHPYNKGIKHITGSTNRTMADAAIKHFGFTEVVKKRKKKKSRRNSNEEVQLHAHRRTFIAQAMRTLRRHGIH